MGTKISILVPLPFIIYINDFFNLRDALNSTSFADDVTFSFGG